MTDKEKQLEEMAKVLSTVKRCKALALSECIKKKCEYPHYEGVTCIAEHQAEKFYEQGYRKIPEGSVVLTNDEYSDYLILKDKYAHAKERNERLQADNERLYKNLGKFKESVQKETAEKILQIIKEEYGYIGNLEKIITKQFGVEIKE